jgi:hypothetical protein
MATFFLSADRGVPVQDEEEAAPPPTRLFHLQGELIERSLASIQPGRAGVREQYFVGFAPDASEEVFVRELRYVKRLFDERFGTAGRSIALASSNNALEELPIASVTNLARALERVGRAMNSDEDAGAYIMRTATASIAFPPGSRRSSSTAHPDRTAGCCTTRESSGA